MSYGLYISAEGAMAQNLRLETIANNLANVDSAGFCHQLPELDYTNNVIEVPIFIPAHPGRQGAGPLAGNKEAVVEDNCSNGK